jgi:hypothetical protein
VTGAHLRAVLVGVAVAVLAACGGPAPGAAVPAAAPAAPVARVPPPATSSPAAPVELDVPAIGVHARPLLDLGIDAAGALEVPPEAVTAAWFTLAPTPGPPDRPSSRGTSTTRACPGSSSGWAS